MKELSSSTALMFLHYLECPFLSHGLSQSLYHFKDLLGILLTLKISQASSLPLVTLYLLFIPL